MSRLDELLLRFRRLVVPPGLAAPAAVSIDRTEDLALELRDVFAAIDEIEDEAAAIEAAGSARATAVADDAMAARTSVLLDGERRAADVRADVLRRHVVASRREARAALAAARAEASRIDRSRRERVPELVSWVVERVGNPTGGPS